MDLPYFLQVISAIIEFEVDFTPQQWQDLVVTQWDDGAPEGAMMKCLSEIPPLIRRGRHAKLDPNPDPAALDSIKDDVRSLDTRFAATLETLRHRFRTNEVNSFSKAVAKVFGEDAVRSLYIRMYSLGLATEILIVLLLDALKIDTEASVERLRHASHEMLALADEAIQWLPLGAMSMITCLLIAWVGARDVSTKHALWATWLSYESIIGGGFVPSEAPMPLGRAQRRLALEST